MNLLNCDCEDIYNIARFRFLLNFLFIKESWKIQYISFHKNVKQYNCFQHAYNHNVSWAVNQHYYDFWRSCDTEDWSNDAENTALSTEIN